MSYKSKKEDHSDLVMEYGTAASTYDVLLSHNV